MDQEPGLLDGRQAGVTVMHRPNIRAFLVGDAARFRPDYAVMLALWCQFIPVDSHALACQSKPFYSVSRRHI